MSANPSIVMRQIKDVAVVTIQEAALLNTTTIDRLGESLFELVDKKALKRISLDFSRVKFLASSALGMLLNLRKKATAIDGTVVICGIHPELHKVFKITNLDKLFGFFDTEEEALHSFGVSTTG